MDLERLLTDRLTPAFTAVAGGPVDPVVRRSPRADFQSDAALALARRLGRPPREIAQAVLDRAVLDDVCAAAEVSGLGFVNLTIDDGALAGMVAALAADDRLGRAGDRRARQTRGGRLLGAQRREGDARRPPALDVIGDALPGCSAARRHRSSGRTTSATGAPRSGC